MPINSWGADVLISMPTPPSQGQPNLVDLGDGFCMTAGGIYPCLNDDEFEEYVTPTYSPSDTGQTDDGRDG